MEQKNYPDYFYLHINDFMNLLKGVRREDEALAIMLTDAGMSDASESPVYIFSVSLRNAQVLLEDVLTQFNYEEFYDNRIKIKNDYMK
jgi:hypothetical protein